ncbi:MAG TPA: WYL domain-containing protein [Ilumatobacteraceae bacterium]
MDTPARLLRLLVLLSAREAWTAAQLAERLEVTERTVRRDMTRLRSLGYPVAGSSGPYGGYALGAGGRLPPLVLDDDEAVAVAMGLRAAAAGGAPGVESAALSALTKLDRVLPVALREQVGALRSVTVGIGRTELPAFAVDLLVTTALACSRPERLRFSYTDASDNSSERLVEPFRLVFTSRSWYLVAYDTNRADWRTFRVDRMSELKLTGARFVHRDAPDAARLVAEGVALHAHTLHARVRLHVPIAEAHTIVSRTVGILEPDTDPNATIARIGGDADWIARYVASLECRVEVLEPEEVRAELRALAGRLAADHSA